jgi:hypothetical protein
VQRLLVGEQRGYGDAEAYGERRLTKRCQSGEGSDHNRSQFRDQPDLALALIRIDQEARDHGQCAERDGNQQRPDRIELLRQESTDGPEHGEQDESADAADRLLGLAPLLALDADQRADQDRDHKILDGGKIEVDDHVRDAPCGESGAALWLPPSSTAAAARTRIVPIVSRAPKG